MIDCVGPLSQLQSGSLYILTVMCASTRFPEAVPMRNITAKSVIRALTKCISTFGLPKMVTNFKSKLFKQILKMLGVEHVLSSPYHPESQGALERWHQTLKSMLRKYCIETGGNWDEGLPFVLFAAWEVVQKSLGFSPAKLVFGHTLCCPLAVLKGRFLPLEPSDETNILDAVSQFREQLYKVR